MTVRNPINVLPLVKQCLYFVKYKNNLKKLFLKVNFVNFIINKNQIIVYCFIKTILINYLICFFLY